MSARRFSSARLPALSLDAPDGWTLEFDKKGHKLTASSEAARLLVSTAVLIGGGRRRVAAPRLAETQRALGFEVGATFTDRIGDLPAAGFLATGPTRSVCTWMVKRDTHLATSVICTADGKPTARDACRAPLATPPLAHARARASTSWAGQREPCDYGAARYGGVGCERIRVADRDDAGRGRLREHPGVGVVRDARSPRVRRARSPRRPAPG